MKNNLLVLTGGLLGGVLGYFIFGWLVSQRYHALVLPGGCVGLGAGVFKCKSTPVAIGCGCLALVFGIFSEWHNLPFADDASLSYFLSHLAALPPLVLVMLLLGTCIGFYVPFRRRSD